MHPFLLYLGFILGNLLHTLYSAYQFVQVQKRFCCYKECFKVLGIPVFVRMVVEVALFGLVLQNPSLTAWAIKLFQGALEFMRPGLASEIQISPTALSMFLLGFIADIGLLLLAQKYAAKYPWLVLVIPTLPDLESKSTAKLAATVPDEKAA